MRVTAEGVAAEVAEVAEVAADTHPVGPVVRKATRPDRNRRSIGKNSFGKPAEARKSNTPPRTILLLRKCSFSFAPSIEMPG
jgi:hypothetical protein